MKLFAIVGAGGFGREVMPVAHEMLTSTIGTTDFELVFIVENLKNKIMVNKHQVMNIEDFLSYESDEKYFNIAIADYKARERIANKLINNNVKPYTIKAQNSIIYDNNIIGEGAILYAFTTISSNIKIGRFFHLNSYSYVGHDCTIGDFVTFAPRVSCNGNVIIEDYAYIGTGAVIKPGTNDQKMVIGKGSIIGMGAIVTKSVLPFTTVIGNPAKIMIKEISKNN